MNIPQCRKHLTILQGKPTRYGRRYSCPCCTVVWWGDARVTPADKETRDARMATHALLDPLWQEKPYHREWLYKTIAQALGIPKKKAHIGLMNIKECLLVQAMARGLREESE